MLLSTLSALSRQLRCRLEGASRTRRRTFRPRLEALEDRLAPSIVTTLADGSFPGTLRYCASKGGPVTFAGGLNGVIDLTLGTEIRF